MLHLLDGRHTQLTNNLQQLLELAVAAGVRSVIHISSVAVRVQSWHSKVIFAMAS